MRAFKTVNDNYIEPISFTVPRRSEVFQADIYPPAIGTKPGLSASEWLSGAEGKIPAKIDLEAVSFPYESRPKSVSNRFQRLYRNCLVDWSCTQIRTESVHNPCSWSLIPPPAVRRVPIPTYLVPRSESESRQGET